jgi:acetyl esterase/lipase
MSEDITTLPPVHAEERIFYGEDPNQFIDFWRPATTPARGAVVMIHGGFWRARYDLTHAGHACAALARTGFATASLEYRRVGNVGGGWPGSFADVVAGFNRARQQFADPTNVVVMGHSAGGHLGLLLASEVRAIRAVVALAPVACLDLAYELSLSNGAVAEFMGGTPCDLPGAYQAACPSRHDSPVPRKLIHGTTDTVVPISLSRCFIERRNADPGAPSLEELAGCDHFDLIDPKSKAWPVILRLIGEGVN